MPSEIRNGGNGSMSADDSTTFADLIKNHRVTRPSPLWALQEIQNSISFAIDIPLRIVCGDTVRKFAGDMDRLRDEVATAFRDVTDLIRETVNDPIACTGKIRKATEENDTIDPLFDFLERNLWLTGGSYCNPSLTYLREHRPWRRWETYHVLHACMEGAPIQTIGEEAMMLAVTYLEDIDGWLIAGPGWKWKSADLLNGLTGPDYNERFVEEVLRAIEAKKGPIIDDRRMQNLGVVRAACTVADLESRIERSVWIFRLAARTLVNAGSIIEWHRHARLGANHWIGLAQLGLLLTDDLASAVSRDTKELRFKPPTLKYRRPPTENDGSGADEEDDHSFGEAIAIRAKPAGHDDWQLTFHDTGNGKEDWEWDEGATHRLQLLGVFGRKIRGKVAIDADIRLSRLVDKIATSRNYFLEERLRLFRFRLDDQLAAFLDESPLAVDSSFAPPPGNRHTAYSPITLEALRTLCRAFNADVCAIYQYDPLERGLRMWEGYYRRPELRAKCMASTADHMWTIRKDPAERENSLSYRVLGCGCADVEPYGRNITLPDDDDSPRGIALSVPIQICGRTWGVLELRGESAFQLRASTPRWLDEFGRVIGGILFTRWINAQLHGLNVALIKALGTESENPSLNSAYEILCQRLAAIFLVETVSLWRRLPNEPGTEFRDVFECKASVKHPSDNRQPHVPHGAGNSRGNTPSWFSVAPPIGEHEKGLGAAFVNDKMIWWHEDLQELHERGLDEGAYFRDLVSAGYRDYCLVKFKNNTGGYDDIMAFASDRRRGFDKRWNGLFRFFSSYVGVLLGLIDSRSRFLGSAERVLVHEIGAYGTAIEDATKSLRDCLNPLFGSPEANGSGKGDMADRTLLFIDALVSGNEQQLRSVSGLDGDVKGILKALKALFRTPARAGRRGRRFLARRSLDRLLGSTASLEKDVKTILSRLNGDPPEPPIYHGKPSDLAAVYNDVVKAKRWWTGAGAITFDGAYEGPRIRMPYQPLRKLVQNLVINARKYDVGRGPVRVLVREYTGEWARMEIINIGWAIAKEDIDRIFVDGVRSVWAREFWPNDGEGLGLAIAKRIADEWGVQLQVHTDPVATNTVLPSHNSVQSYRGEDGSVAEGEFQRFTFSLVFPESLLTSGARRVRLI